MNSDNGYRSFCRRLGLNICALLVSVSALSCETGPADPGGNDNNAGSPNPAVWSAAFLTEGAGALSSVWGSGPEDVFIVGGKPEQGEVYHFDGNNWRRMNLPPVSMLVWVFGFGPNDVFAVGFEGGVIRYDGIQWQMLDTGTSESLWGVWGKSPDDLWIVGGDSAPLILHFDGSAFTRVEAPANDRDAESLFKVWGIGRKAFVVGDNGLILELIDGDWEQVPGGADADDDFVSLWGTGESHIFAVGGRTSARVARYDGTAWTTHKPDATPGLNGAFLDGSIAICGGVGGFVGSVDLSTGEVTAEESGATLDIHAVWGDGAGRHYAVGGRFSGNLEGIALVRTVGEPTTSPAAPLPPICHSDDECDDANACTADRCDDGECTHIVAADCDGSQCFVQVCDNGDCTQVPTDCDDEDPCTLDACVDGQCMNMPMDCDDGDSCTVDTCIEGSCLNEPLDCDDNNDCTQDACVGGECENALIPDCACDDETDCPAGTDCLGERCVAVGGPDIEVGVDGGTIPCTLGPYRRIHPGDEFGICEGPQTLGDGYVTVRFTGFPDDAAFYVRSYISLHDSICSASQACDPAFYVCLDGECSPTNDITDGPVAVEDAGGATIQIRDHRMLVGDQVENLDGAAATVFIEILAVPFNGDPHVTANTEIDVVLFGQQMCADSDECAAGQTCENGYCDRP